VKEPDEVGPNQEQGLFGYFFLGRQSGLLEKVTRRKGGTILSITANNGYTRPQQAIDVLLPPRINLLRQRLNLTLQRIDRPRHLRTKRIELLQTRP
jgi:hypothetical protein